MRAHGGGAPPLILCYRHPIRIGFVNYTDSIPCGAAHLCAASRRKAALHLSPATSDLPLHPRLHSDGCRGAACRRAARTSRDPCFPPGGLLSSGRICQLWRERGEISHRICTSLEFWWWFWHDLSPGMRRVYALTPSWYVHCARGLSVQNRSERACGCGCGYGWESVGTPNLPLTFPDTPTGSTWHVEHLDGDVVGDNHEEGKDASVSA